MNDVTPQWGSIVVDPTRPSLPSLKLKFLLDRLPKSGRLLEIGSGGGKILRSIAQHHPGLELHGCDVRAPQSPPDVYEFKPIEGDRLPYDDGSFDVVLVFDVLEHVPDPRALLREVARLLTPGGKLLAFIPVEGETVSFYTLFRALFGKDVYVETKEHVQSFTHDELRRMLRETFELREVRYVYHLLGQFMDAAFFAAARWRTLKTYWWKDAAVYHGKKADSGALTKALNVMVDAGNALAWAESTIFSRSEAGAAGILVDAARRT